MAKGFSFNMVVPSVHVSAEERSCLEGATHSQDERNRQEMS